MRLSSRRSHNEVAYLAQHAGKSIALNHVEGNRNQNLMEDSRKDEGGQQAGPSLAKLVPCGDVDVPDHPVVHRHVPQRPILPNALSIPPRLYMQMHRPMYADIFVCASL